MYVCVHVHACSLSEKGRQTLLQSCCILRCSPSFSLCTTLCLQWEPQAIAVAFLYLAGKLTKFDLQGLSQSKSRSWWRQFVDTLDFHDLECE